MYPLLDPWDVISFDVIDKISYLKNTKNKKKA